MSEKQDAQPIITAEDLTYKYPDGTNALCDVSFSVPARSKTVLLGPNGAGKSTLLLCLAGLFQPASGQVTVDGTALPTGPGRARVPSLLGKVGLVFQDPDDQLFEVNVWEDVCYGPRSLGLSSKVVEERVREALEMMHLRDLYLRPPHHLSLGQKRRVAIAGVVAMRPSIVILDEPTAFLDPTGVADLLSALGRLHQEGITLVIATHDVDFAAEWADYVLIMQEGTVYAAGPRQLLAEGDLLRKCGLRLPLVTQVFSGMQLTTELPTTVDAGRSFLRNLLRQG